MKPNHKFTPAQVRAAKNHVQALYEDARSEYFSKLRTGPHPRVGDVDELLSDSALLWLALKKSTCGEEVADWILWSVSFAEVHTDTWGVAEYEREG